MTAQVRLDVRLIERGDDQVVPADDEPFPSYGGLQAAEVRDEHLELLLARHARWADVRLQQREQFRRKQAVVTQFKGRSNGTVSLPRRAGIEPLRARLCTCTGSGMTGNRMPGMSCEWTRCQVVSLGWRCPA